MKCRRFEASAAEPLSRPDRHNNDKTRHPYLYFLRNIDMGAAAFSMTDCRFIAGKLARPCRDGAVDPVDPQHVRAALRSKHVLRDGQINALKQRRFTGKRTETGAS